MRDQRSEPADTRVRSFRDLLVWQRSMQLCVAVYELTKSFPKEEVYGLSSQVRRASISICSNIAEGHGRGTLPQLIHFLLIARGSTFEVQAQLILCRELGFAPAEPIARCESLCDEISKMLFATLKSLKAKQNDRSANAD